MIKNRAYMVMLKLRIEKKKRRNPQIGVRALPSFLDRQVLVDHTEEKYDGLYYQESNDH